ncbi:MAG: adenylate/guanylate cyclase domain-containing protein [Nitrospirae bacterium]|nr:adenylate/guanylate cyclase domain-containing protein [Nitrospirota bacterium]
MALAGGVLTIFLGLSPMGELTELKGYDLLHFFLRPEEPPKELIIVAIDEPSFAEMGLQWPWPRSIHARLVDRLAAEGASVIGFDIIFSEPSSPYEDRIFAEALRKSDRVILASDITSAERGAYLQEMVVEPIPLFLRYATAGIATVPLDRDYVVRRLYPDVPGERRFAEAIAERYAQRQIVLPPADAMISYRIPPGRAGIISFYQALEPDRFLPRGFFKQKIVMVGKCLKSATEKTSDYYATPFIAQRGFGLMSGVEIQANMVLNFLQDDFVQGINLRWKIALTFLIALCGSFVQVQWKPLRSACLAVGGVLLSVAVSSVVFNRFRIWLPAISLSSLFMFPYAVFGVHAFVSSERKRRELRRLFAQYLSPSILKNILEHPESVKLGGVKVEATVLFSDIAGFTTMSEKMQPEEISHLLNIYLTEMTKIIFEQQGTVDKFIGDAIMAFWGAPLPDDDHALHACQAALEMQQRLRELRRNMVLQGYPELFVRIGISTGMVIAGNMGSDQLFDYTVLGDTVNVASRLEGTNKEFGTSIIISGPVFEKVKDRLSVRYLATVKVRGKTEAVRIYELPDNNPED